MEERIEVYCPYCGELGEVVIDASGGAVQRYIEDCYVCCNPRSITVRLTSEGQTEVSVSTLDEV